MKKKTTVRKVKHLKSEQTCEIYRSIATFAASLNRAANATDVQNDRLKSAPLSLLAMVF